jgi:hypothetical protein
MNFSIDVRFVEVGGTKIRLLSDAEKHNINTWLKDIDPDEPQASTYKNWLKNDEDAKALGTEVIQYLVCFVPTYEDKLLIEGNALAKMRQTAAPLDLEMSNEALERFRLEVQAKTLSRKVTDSEGKEIVTSWDSIWSEKIWPETWRQSVCGLVNMAVTLSEEERSPLFSGPKGK